MTATSSCGDFPLPPAVDYVQILGMPPSQYSVTYATPASWACAAVGHELASQAQQIARLEIKDRNTTERLAIIEHDIESLQSYVGVLGLRRV